VGEQEDLALDLLGRRLGVNGEDGDAVFVDRTREVPPRPAGRPADGQIRTAIARSAGWLVTRPAISSGSTATSVRSASSASGNSGSTRRCSSAADVIHRRRGVIWNHHPSPPPVATGT
jgi:hypothetical protein